MLETAFVLGTSSQIPDGLSYGLVEVEQHCLWHVLHTLLFVYLFSSHDGPQESEVAQRCLCSHSGCSNFTRSLHGVSVTCSHTPTPVQR